MQAQEPTLAEAINNVVSNIQSTNSPWSVTYSQIFGSTCQPNFDIAILQALSQKDYTDVIFIARLAEINGYSSTIINNSIIIALQNIPMAGSLPITTINMPSTLMPHSFSLYDRYMVNAYRYALELHVSGWNINQAFADFATQYLKPPENSNSGEMLWINPKDNFSESYGSRYYDEHAETLGMFLEFALSGVNTTVAYGHQLIDVKTFMDDAWLNTQAHWNGQFYNYADYVGDYSPILECEIGNFAQIITEYQNFRGNIPYFDRVINDLQYALLSSAFNSPAWGPIGVLKHADNNPQLRLEETMGALIALQMLYPYFSSGMQANFRSMLGDSETWKGLLGSGLYRDGQFRFTDESGGTYTDDASSLGAMTIFLYGIIPDTGYLAINASNEASQDYRTCFPTSQWQFNYQNHFVRIPVMAGNLRFIFGSREVTQSFPSNGVYNVQFSSDWNNIISVTKIADINSAKLQPVTIQAISHQELAVTSTPTSPTLTSTPTPNSTAKPTSTLKPTLKTDNNQSITIPIILSIIAISIISELIYRNRKRKSIKRKI